MTLIDPLVVARQGADLVEPGHEVGGEVLVVVAAQAGRGDALGGVGGARDRRRDARGQPQHPEWAGGHQRYLRGARGPMPQTISYAIVPSRSAHSCAVTSASPWRPMSTTSSPTATASVTDVHHQLVHRHGPGDRMADAADHDLAPDRGEVARHAVGVADRHRRDRGSAAPIR